MAGNPERELRNEARFRLALMLADRLSRPRDAAVLLRQILDETPDAARVRLELARMQAMLGNLGSAAREMRAAQAGGLPPDVERMVRFYAAALADARPFGAQVEVALAPDSNINRATRADTLSTIIGDFSLSDDARARSGTGLALRGQAFARRRLNPAADLMLRASASANLYAAREFDDVIVALQAGPDLKRGRDRIAFGVGPSWRWYGMQPYSATLGATLDWQHPLGSRAQAKLALGAGRVTNRRNLLQSGPTYSAALSLDRAIDARSGVGAQLAASRDGARDPASPPPMGGNISLLGTQVSETYRNVDAQARLSVPNSGAAPTVTASGSTLTIVYDAAAGTYTLTNPAASQNFGGANYDASQSTSTLTTYKVVSGNIVDTFSLTIPATGFAPTKYVASGFWQRQITGSSSTEGVYDALVYGAATASTAVPTSGAATFQVALLGAASSGSTITGHSGSGTLYLDFLSGGVAASGYYGNGISTTPRTSGTGWRANALLSSNSSQISGAITLDGAGIGSVSGLLFGPNAEEVGLVYAVNSVSGGSSAVGTIVGPRVTNVLNTGSSTINSSSPMMYRTLTAAQRASLASDQKLSNINAGTGPVAIYQTNNATSTFYYADGRIETGATSTAGYRYRDGRSQYASSVGIIDTRGGFSSYESSIYGIETAVANIPRSGTASIKVGMGGAIAVPGDTLATLSGNGTVLLNFAAASLSTQGTYGVYNNAPVVTNGLGSQLDSGTWSGSATIATGTNSFSGPLTLTGTTTYSGTFIGRLFGPAAEAIGAVFDLPSSAGGRATGAMTGNP